MLRALTIGLCLSLSTLAVGSETAENPTAPTADTVLVLTTGQAMFVRSYSIKGRVCNIIGADGEPLMVRADTVDLDASQAQTEAFAARKRDEQAKVEAEAEQARLEAIEAAERNQRHLSKSVGAGSMSSFGGGAIASPSTESAPFGSTTTAAPADGDTAAWKARFDALRSEYRAALRAIDATSKQHDAIAKKHNESSNVTERAIAQKQVADLRLKLAELRTKPPEIRERYSALQVEARRARVDAVAYRAGVE